MLGSLAILRNNELQIEGGLETTHKSIESSKVGPQYSFLEIPSWYALAKEESWFNYVDVVSNIIMFCANKRYVQR